MSKKMYDNPYKNGGVDVNSDKESGDTKEESAVIEEQKNEQEDGDDVAIKKYQERIGELEQQVAELNKKLIYSLAENENSRKRLSQEKVDAVKFANGKILSSFVDPIECLYIARQLINSDEKKSENILKSIKDGFEMTINKFEQIFGQYDIARIYPMNGKFDYKLHQAISHIEHDSEPESIVQVVSAGYTLNGVLVKPAMVVVSNGKK